MNTSAMQCVQQPASFPRITRLAILLLVALPLAFAGPSFSQEKAGSPPVKVTIKDDTPIVIEPVLPVDPQRRINYQPAGLSVTVRGINNETMHLSHFPSLMIDNQFFQQGQGGRPEFDNRPLQPKDGKKPEGFSSCHVYPNGIKVTMTATVEASKPCGNDQKRKRDTMLIRYAIENTSKQAHTVGLRIYMDTFIVDNDGCLFAAPATEPNKILDGVVLKDKKLPPFVQLLQRPDLKAPGFVAHLTLDLGSKLEKPEKVVLTRHGAGFGGWDMPAMIAGGDSALGVFWEPKELKAGAKRELAYGYGMGVLANPENEGLVDVALGGSFEPGKQFTVTAYVSDPGPGQSLTLEVADGMALVEGKAQQSVPELREGEVQSVVMWQARVLRTGEFNVRVRSSTGVTHGKTITVALAK
jgi:hypothetical protein